MGTDCDDTNPNIHNYHDNGDGIDDNGNGTPDDGVQSPDDDGDGFTL